MVQQNLTVDFSDANHAVIWHTDQSPVATEFIAAETDLFRAQALDLLAAIRDDRPTLAPIEEGVRSLRLALAAVHSAEAGIPVAIETI